MKVSWWSGPLQKCSPQEYYIAQHQNDENSLACKEKYRHYASTKVMSRIDDPIGIIQSPAPLRPATSRMMTGLTNQNLEGVEGRWMDY
jgi:hypothetical protein